jgi:DNA-binding MarR family transcriptional regulator
MNSEKPSSFSPAQQLIDLNARLLLSLQRLGDMLKAMQWEQARQLGITPLQLQILLFAGHHPAAVNKVAYIAAELQLSRPTISDAVAALVTKGLLQMEEDKRDRRSFSLLPTDAGNTVLQQAEDYSAALNKILDKRPLSEKEGLYEAVFAVISGLSDNDKGGVQRACYTCAHYEGNKRRQHACRYLNKKLSGAELQIDCMYHSSLS